MTTIFRRFSPRKFIGELAKMKPLFVAAFAFTWLAVYSLRGLNEEALRRLFYGLMALVKVGLVALVCGIALVLLFVAVVGICSAFSDARKDP